MKTLSAVLALVFSLLSISCVLDTQPTQEPVEETSQSIPIGGFNASEFKFVTTLPESSPAGGWQVAKANLKFWAIHLPPRAWQCPVTVEMPFRAEKMGRISSKRAATMSAEVATATMQAMNFKLPQGIFC